MSDRFQAGSYPLSYQQTNPHYSSNRNTYDYDAEKQRNSYNIKESNISQQTIIHKARLYSPDKNQQAQRNRSGNHPTQNSNLAKTKAKKNQIGAKIHQIIDMCESDQQAEIQEFKGVIQAQRGILNMFNEHNARREHQVPNIDLSNFADGHYDRGTTFGPIRQPNPHIAKIQSKQVSPRQYQSHNAYPQHQTQHQSHNNQQHNQQQQQQHQIGRQNSRDNNIYKKSAIDDLKTDRNAEQAVHPSQAPKSNFQNHVRRISDQNRPLNDETQKMIQEIQRKAMEQIQSLRNDKIDLMRRLNEEIKLHNEEKRLRIRLEGELARLRGGASHKPASPQAQQYAQNNYNTQQKYHSQPHYQQRPQSPSSQTYFPPHLPYQYTQSVGPQHPSLPIRSPSPSGQYSPIRPHHHPHQQHQNNQQHNTLPSQHASIPHHHDHQHQINRLQVQNNNLLRTIRTAPVNQTYKQKQQLRHQVIQLNQLIQKYQYQIQKLRQFKSQHNDNDDGSRQLEQLLNQGEIIETNTLKLLRQNVDGRHNQRISQRVPTSQDIIQDANTFKRRLVEVDNQRSNKNISLGPKKSSQSFGSNRISSPYIAADNDSYKYQQFEKVLYDLKNAAR